MPATTTKFKTEVFSNLSLLCMLIARSFHMTRSLDKVRLVDSVLLINSPIKLLFLLTTKPRSLNVSTLSESDSKFACGNDAGQSMNIIFISSFRSSNYDFLLSLESFITSLINTYDCVVFNIGCKSYVIFLSFINFDTTTLTIETPPKYWTEA